MRAEASAACLSWIPPTAVEGAFRLPFGLGIAHYDQPPPDAAPDIDALLAADAIRFANQLHAWIEVDDGRIVTHGMSGRLTHKSALLRYHDWLRESGNRGTPWDGMTGAIPVTSVTSAGERSLANTILVSGGYRQHRLPAGAFLSERPIADTEIHLLLDGLLLIEIDHQPAVEAGPGAIFDPVLRTEQSKEHVAVRAQTPCRLAVVSRSRLDEEALLGAATAQRSRFNAFGSDPAQASGPP